MSFDINEDTLGVWFVSWEPNGGDLGGDWFACAWRTADGAEAGYRFTRNGQKEWTDLKPLKADAPVHPQDAIRALQEMAGVIEMAMHGQRWELLRGAGSFEQFIEHFMSLPFVQAKKVTRAVHQ